MAYVCLDGLLAAGVNIVGVMGAKPTHNTYNNFKTFALSRKMNYIEWSDLKDKNFLDYIKSLNADIAVVCSFNYKIPVELLNSVKDGFLNVHPSLLPKYRGGNPYSTVIINNEKETGVTIHFMDEGFDTGDIVAQKKVPISDIETMGTLFNRLNMLGMQMLVSVLEQYEHGALVRYKQPDGEFISGQSLKDEDLFIDYTKSAVEIERFIRALNPFLIASTHFRTNMMKVFMVKVYGGNSKKYKPGTVAKVDKDKFLIATGNGFICPTTVQFGSFFVGNTQDFLRIIAPKEGEVFV